MVVEFKDRSELEDFLIDMDIDSVTRELLAPPYTSSYLRDILYSGWKGICQMTDEELIEEFNCRTEDTAVILTDGNGDVKLTVVK